MKANEIKDYRKQKELNQTQLGALCGVTNSAVSRWEKEIDKPSGSALKILERLINGETVISNITPLEAKLLDENVNHSPYKNREEFLTESLKHLILHGEFLTLESNPRPNLKEITHNQAAEPEAHYKFSRKNIITPEQDDNENSGEANTLQA
tara:strand:+ start:1193 stop:1648 length:456 start_codon:yes stop_codon:yes gene_type:complete